MLPYAGINNWINRKTGCIFSETTPVCYIITGIDRELSLLRRLQTVEAAKTGGFRIVLRSATTNDCGCSGLYVRHGAKHQGTVSSESFLMGLCLSRPCSQPSVQDVVHAMRPRTMQAAHQLLLILINSLTHRLVDPALERPIEI